MGAIPFRTGSSFARFAAGDESVLDVQGDLIDIFRKHADDHSVLVFNVVECELKRPGRIFLS